MAGWQRDFTSVCRGFELVLKALNRRNCETVEETWRRSAGIRRGAVQALSSGNLMKKLPNDLGARLSIVAEGLGTYFIPTANATNYKTEDKLKEPYENSSSANKREFEASSNRIIENGDNGFQLGEETIQQINAEQPKDEIISQPAINHVVPQNIETHRNGMNELIDMEQKLSTQSVERKVPSSRLRRLISYGNLAAGLGVGAIAEIGRRTLNFTDITDSNAISNPFLTEANAARLVETLCRVRGGALKLGQMLSIQDNTMISPQFQAIFERVRQSADFMPKWQTEKTLVRVFGKKWADGFKTFDMKPFAAASIGQVHKAVLHDEREVAVKIQYPGVADGIESDIKNLMAVLKVWNIFPKGLFVDSVMSVARRDLAKEVDYIQEADNARKFKELLEPSLDYYVPQVIDELSTKNIFTTELAYGLPLDKCAHFEQEIRNKICTKVLKLCIMELVQFKFMQSDPNWSNFLYNPNNDQIILLDFGACAKFGENFVDNYVKLLKAAAAKDREAVVRFSLNLNFLTGYETKVMTNAHVDAVVILAEPFSFDGLADFSRQDITKRVHEIIPVMIEHRLSPPPEEIYSLHRKLAGVFLLCTKLNARINCYNIFNEMCGQYQYN